MATIRLQYCAEDLHEILRLHELWMLGKGGERADLRNADLAGVKLPDGWLSGIRLSGADLRADASNSTLFFAVP